MNKDIFVSIVCLQNRSNKCVNALFLLFLLEWNFIYFRFSDEMSKLSMHMKINELFKRKATKRSILFYVKSKSHEFGNMQYK